MADPINHSPVKLNICSLFDLISSITTASSESVPFMLWQTLNRSRNDIGNPLRCRYTVDADRMAIARAAENLAHRREAFARRYQQIVADVIALR
jgi:hypothetical protein